MQPSDLKALFLEALALKEKGSEENLCAAKEKLNTILANVPKPTHRTVHMLGVIEWEQNNKEEALKLFRQAVSITPNHPALLRSLGLAVEGEERIKYLKEASGLVPENTEILMHLAKAQKKDYLDDSEATLRRWLEREPTSARVNYKLGHALLHKKTLEGAKAAVSFFNKAIALDPSYESAKYWLAVAVAASSASDSDLSTPAVAPASYVQKLFDGYADTFDSHLVGKLGYQTPELLRDLVVETLTSGKACTDLPKFSRCADLGCGTGLAGVAFRDMVSEHMAGVDLSSKMVDKARAREGIYQNLVVGDLVPFLAAGSDSSERYDLVVAADTLPYIGALEPLMLSLQGTCADGAHVAFSVEFSEEATCSASTPASAAQPGESAAPPSPPASTSGSEGGTPTPAAGDKIGYRLQLTGRYCHSPWYLKAAAEAHGFRLLAQKEATLRYNQGTAIRGLLVLLKKKES